MGEECPLAGSVLLLAFGVMRCKARYALRMRPARGFGVQSLNR